MVPIRLLVVHHVLCFIITGIIIVPGMICCSARAEVYTVNTANELKTTLAICESNLEDDVINIEPGLYSLTEPLSYDPAAQEEDYSITLRSTTDAQVILDGSNGTQVLSFRTYTSNGHVTLKHLTLTNGFVTSPDQGAGGWIWVHNAHILIQDCVFDDNRASALYQGTNAAGLFVKIGSSGRIDIRRSLFKDNYAKGIGGGAYFNIGFGGTVNLVNNIFHSNEATTQGAGFYLSMITGSITLTNNTLTRNNNSAGNGYGGGGCYISCYYDTVTCNIYNNIIWGNQSASGLGQDIYLKTNNDPLSAGATVKVFNNSFSNMEITVSDNLTQGNNIDSDPLFVLDDPLSQLIDPHIQTDSPCIDAALSSAPLCPALDFDQDRRFARPDMGADEIESIPITAPTLNLLLF